MSNRQVPQSDWAGFFNELVSCYGVSELLSLDSGQLLQAAQGRTGLSDFGDSAFMEPLES